VNRTTIYLDTEFNGFGGQLISMGLVVRPGRSLYFVLPLPDDIDPWVQEHVIPNLLRRAPTPPDIARAILANWLAEIGPAHIIADWPEDIAHFCQFLITGPGTRIDTPSLTFEIRRDLNSERSTVPHNALYDAIAIAAMDADLAALTRKDSR
jgi:hypothetical protein